MPRAKSSVSGGSVNRTISLYGGRCEGSRGLGGGRVKAVAGGDWERHFGAHQQTNSTARAGELGRENQLRKAQRPARIGAMRM